MGDKSITVIYHGTLYVSDCSYILYIYFGGEGSDWTIIFLGGGGGRKKKN